MHFHILPQGTKKYCFEYLYYISTTPSEFRKTLLAFSWGWDNANLVNNQGNYEEYVARFYWRQLTKQLCVYNANFTQRPIIAKYL